MVFGKVREIVAEKMEIEENEVTLETSLLKDLKADSLDAVEIIMAIEDAFDIEIPNGTAEGFLKSGNVGDIVKFVESKI